MKKSVIQFIRSAEKLDDVTAFASNYAKQHNLNLHLLMIVESRHGYFYPMTSPLKADLTTYEFERIRGERMEEEKKNLKEYVEKKNKTGGDPHIDYTIESGATDLVMTEFSKKKETELIIINEMQEPENGFIINSYLNIIENTACPVLKIPKDFDKSKNIKKILYATDYKEEDIPTLKKLAKIASSLSANITALHITDSIDLEEKMLSHGFENSIREKTGYEDIKMRIHDHKNVVEGILDFAKEGNFDLIVLLKENRNFFQKIFSKSESNKILSEADIPVMIYHE